MKRLQKGFTLIELMIVVAIVGILAAVAIPAYMDYVVRSKVSEGLAAMGACKTSVSEYYMVKNGMPADLAASGCSNVATQYMTGIDVAAGVITMTVTNTHGGTDPDGKTLVLTPAVAGKDITGWACTTTATHKYVPAQCRG